MVNPLRGKSGNALLLLIIIAALALSGAIWFASKNGITPENNAGVLPTQTRPPSNTSATPAAPSEKHEAATFSITPFPVENLDREGLIKKIEENTSPKMIAEKADISPSDKSLAAFFGHDDAWKMFGLFLVDLKTFTAKSVYAVNESITGRGAYFMDNSALEFSPSGEALYMNRTGINFPAFLVADKSGKLLINSRDGLKTIIGHATWVGPQQLLYLEQDAVFLYDTGKKSSSPTKLPQKIFHLSANPRGTRVAAFAEAKNRLDCESFDLHVYSYPEGTEVAVEPNTLIRAEWKNDTAVGFEKVTGCTKNGEESMFPYSPETAGKTLEVQ